MDLFWKAAAGVLIAAVLGLALGKDISLLLALAVCAMGSVIALTYLEPVLDLIRRLEALAGIQSEMLGILLKAAGISLICELAVQICSDSGSAAFGKTLRFLGSSVILWLSVPLFQAVLNVLQQILGEL